jgi:hypothetical protein
VHYACGIPAVFPKSEHLTRQDVQLLNRLVRPENLLVMMMMLMAVVTMMVAMVVMMNNDDDNNNEMMMMTMVRW